MKLETVLLGNRYKFSSIKEVLAKANEQKSGDSLAGIAAANAKERIAAKEVLSDLTVEEITAEPDRKSVVLGKECRSRWSPYH